MTDTRMFAWEDVASEAGITPEQLAGIERLVREEFPHDDMLYELHVLRACMAVKDGYCTVEQILQQQEPAEQPHA
ncbi:MAG: hypothetical protein FJX75_07980 [Armatimonadetes bacterium]|nr:hypothetical protein [Armatimonadota bacterium]